MTLFKDMPIRRKLLRILFLIIGVVLFVTCVTFFVYEFYAFRKTTVEKLSTISKIIAANSTAALAFEDAEGGKEILAALKTEPHIVAAALYDKNGKIFSTYHAPANQDSLPTRTGKNGYQFAGSHLEGYEPVLMESKPLGTLYIKSDLGAMYERLQLYAIIVCIVVALAFLLAFLLSKILQKSISKPVLNLAETAAIISERKDYSVRAVKTGNDELGLLTQAFNNMLDQIEMQNQVLYEQQRQEQLKIITTALNAQEKERNLIGQELHDNVNQLLVGAKMFLSMVKDDPVGQKHLLISSMETIQQAINENRKLAHALVAPDFEVRILSEQISDLAESMLKKAGIGVQLDLVHLQEDVLDEDQKLNIYRIAQEQCANIIKHAQARMVNIHIDKTADLFTMTITDDGVGMEMKQSSGIGLKNIKSRLSILNGTMHISTEKGKGFSLEIKMPVRKIAIPLRLTENKADSQ